MILKKMNKKIVGIIQARMGSKRFPGKMLAILGGSPILEWVIRRVKNSNTIDKLVVSTTRLEEDDQIIDLSKKFDVECYRGSENNVLGRFAKTAQIFKANSVIRICADNPFIDPIEIDRLVKYFIKNQCDYACNHQNKFDSNYADGFGAEIFSSDILYSMNENVNDPKEEEHLTLHLYNNSSKYSMLGLKAPSELSYPDYRFDIDTTSDLNRLEELCKKGINFNTSSTKIMKLVLEMGF